MACAARRSASADASSPAPVPSSRVGHPWSRLRPPPRRPRRTPAPPAPAPSRPPRPRADPQAPVRPGQPGVSRSARLSAGDQASPGARVHRLVRQAVGVGVAFARDPLVGDPVRREDRRGFRRQRLHRRVLDLPAARHLLDDELGVHADVDPGVRVQFAGGAQAGQQAPVLGDVVGGDADVLGGLRQGLPVAASLTTAPYPAGPGLPRDPPSASTTNSRIGLDPLP